MGFLFLNECKILATVPLFPFNMKSVQSLSAVVCCDGSVLCWFPLRLFLIIHKYTFLLLFLSS